MVDGRLQRHFKDTSMADPSGRAGFCFARSSPNKRTNRRTGVRGKFLLQNIRNFQVICQGESYDQKSEMLNVIYWPAPYILFFFFPDADLNLAADSKYLLTSKHSDALAQLPVLRFFFFLFWVAGKTLCIMSLFFPFACRGPHTLHILFFFFLLTKYSGHQICTVRFSLLSLLLDHSCTSRF